MLKSVGTKPSGLDLRNISLIVLLFLTLSFSLHQTSWAAVITCPASTGSYVTCLGTSGDDLIFSVGSNTFVHGLAGNDEIWAGGANNFLYGDDGNDVLYGSYNNDFFSGGRGNDRIDGSEGHDSINDDTRIEGSLVNNDDIISGGEGDDWIFSGAGSDKIQGGAGADSIAPNGFLRDFSPDYVNCGSGNDRLSPRYLGDGDTVSNCETIFDKD